MTITSMWEKDHETSNKKNIENNVSQKTSHTKARKADTIQNLENPRNITLHGKSMIDDYDYTSTLEWIKSLCNDIKFENMHIISIDIDGADDIWYKLLQENPKVKILYIGFHSPEWYKKVYNTKILDFLLTHPNIQYIRLPFTPEAWWNISFEIPFHTIEGKEKLDLEKNIVIKKLREIQHIYQHIPIEKLYHPETANEKYKAKHVIEETQKYFPWLDTKEKALDYITHVKLDIPEVMKWERIEWVYVDIDWTLIEYVPIWSVLEWKQELRQEVVNLLKNYEQDGKKIIIWTGWNVLEKEKYLRTLGITRPVVSKYDYTGATAEIVVDDTDRWAFILQSRIFPEIYINTRDM